MTPPAALAGPPIIVLRSINREGETYALEPRSLERLRRELGGRLRSHPRIFIAHETAADFEHVHGAIVPQIIQLLTGLSEDELNQLGGVSFQDPVTEKELPRV